MGMGLLGGLKPRLKDRAKGTQNPVFESKLNSLEGSPKFPGMNPDDERAAFYSDGSIDATQDMDPLERADYLFDNIVSDDELRVYGWEALQK